MPTAAAHFAFLTTVCEVFPVLLQPRQPLLYFVFLILTILTEMRRDLMVVLIFMSLMAENGEHFKSLSWPLYFFICELSVQFCSVPFNQVVCFLSVQFFELF